MLAGTCKSLFWFYTVAKNNGGGNNNYCSFKTCKATTKSSPATNQHPAFDRPCTDIFAHTHCIGFCSTGLLLHGHHVLRYTISALTLLVRQQEGHAACKEISHQQSPRVLLWRPSGELAQPGVISREILQLNKNQNAHHGLCRVSFLGPNQQCCSTKGKTGFVKKYDCGFP